MLIAMVGSPAGQSIVTVALVCTAGDILQVIRRIDSSQSS